MSHIPRFYTSGHRDLYIGPWLAMSDWCHTRLVFILLAMDWCHTCLASITAGHGLMSHMPPSHTSHGLMPHMPPSHTSHGLMSHMQQKTSAAETTTMHTRLHSSGTMLLSTPPPAPPLPPTTWGFYLGVGVRVQKGLGLPAGLSCPAIGSTWIPWRK